MPISERHGFAGEHAFVLVHAMPGDSTQMLRLVPELARLGTVVVVDLPDCGSAPDDLSIDPDDAVEDVRRIVASLAPSSVTLVGLSFGGWLAARLASTKAPENLKQLVLLGAFARLTDAHAAAYSVLADDLEAGRKTIGDLTDIAINGFAPSGADDEFEAHVRTLMKKCSSERAIRLLRRAAATALPEFEVGPFDLPAVLLHGRNDAAVPLALGEALRAKARGSELVVLETDSHCLTWSHVADCFRAVARVARSSGA